MLKRMLPLSHSHNLISSLTPEYSYKLGEDIHTFQDNARKKLSELLGICEIEKLSKDSSISVEYDIYADDLGVREIKFYFESEENVLVPCYLFIPKTDKPRPLIVALHGHSTGAHIAMGRKKYPLDADAIKEQRCDFVKQSIKNGYPTLSVEQRAFGERGGTDTGSTCIPAAMQSLLLGRTLLGERVWDTKCAITKVIENFAEFFDSSNIICVGYSGGGTVATYLSALDTRITASVIVSSISRFCDSIGRVPHCACNYVPSIAKYFDMGEICQLMAPRKLLIVSGHEDRIFPATGATICKEIAMSAYKAYGKEANLVHIITNGGHRFYPNEVWNYINNL